MKRSTLILWFFGITVIATVASWYMMLTQSIRLDEAQSIWIATKPLTALLKLTSEDVHVPLYNLLLHFWLQFFGNSVFTSRLLSYGFFLATLPALFILASRVSNKKIALLTIALFSFSPFILWYTSEARMYTMFVFVTTLNHIFFLQFLRSNGEEGKAGYFVSLLLGLYTHYFFLFLIATQVLFVTVAVVSRIRRAYSQNKEFSESLRVNRDMPLRFLLLLIASGLFFVPWLVFVLLSGGFSNTQPLIPPPTSFNLFQTYVNFLFGFQPQGIQALLISLWPLIVIMLFFIFTQKRKVHLSNVHYFVLATFFPVFLVFFLSFFRPIFLSRYLILVTPTLFVLISWILLNYEKRVAAYLTTSVLLLLFVLMIYQNISSRVPVKENYQGTAVYLAEHATPHDIIAVSAPFTIYPIEYSYTGESTLTTIPAWDRYTVGAIPAFSQQSFQTQIDQYKKQYSRLFVVLSYDQGYEENIRKYLNNHFRLVSHKTFSVGLETRVYQLRYDI